MRFIFKFVILLLYIFPSFAYAQEVGSAVKIVNSVKGKIKGKSRTLSKNNPVFSNEKISASSSSHGEFILSDKSRIIVGPNSSVTLDSFLVSGRGFEKGLVNVSKGAFRFISGRSKKGSIKIKTPLTTIGIRGTIFDVYVGRGGVTDVVLFSGKVEVCTRRNNCKTMVANCDIIRVKSGNSIKFREFLRSGNRSKENADYSLTHKQGRFPPRWRAPTGRCSARAILEKIAPAGHESEAENQSAPTPAAPAPAPTPAPTPAPAPTPTPPTVDTTEDEEEEESEECSDCT